MTETSRRDTTNKGSCNSKLLEWKLLGPPADGPRSDLDSWVSRLKRRGYSLLEEDLRWETQDRGKISALSTDSKAFGRPLSANVHLIRLLGEVKDFQVTRLTDRPYGWPASDPGLEPPAGDEEADRTEAPPEEARQEAADRLRLLDLSLDLSDGFFRCTFVASRRRRRKE